MHLDKWSWRPLVTVRTLEPLPEHLCWSTSRAGHPAHLRVISAVSDPEAFSHLAGRQIESTGWYHLLKVTHDVGDKIRPQVLSHLKLNHVG